MDAPPADPYEGTLLYDEPGVRAYIFAQRVHAIAHFLRATHGLGAGGVHARPEIDEDALVRVLTLDHGGRRIGAEARRVNQVVLRQDAHRGRPLDGGQRLVERTADRIVVSDEAARPAGPQGGKGEGAGAVRGRAGA